MVKETKMVDGWKEVQEDIRNVYSSFATNVTGTEKVKKILYLNQVIIPYLYLSTVASFPFLKKYSSSFCSLGFERGKDVGGVGKRCLRFPRGFVERVAFPLD